MVPSQMIRGSLVAALMIGLIPACGSDVSGGGSGEEQGGGKAGPGPGPGPGPDTQPTAHAAYPGTGFIVHEWGTDTVVVGSDGSLQRGLHHEEEDLPGFVYNRIKAGSLAGSTSVNVKMETPITYFYSDKPLTAKVSIGFPQGVFTQWYPAVKSFYPFIVGPNAAMNVKSYMDPVLDVSFPFGQAMCAEKFGAVANGLLDWGSVEVLPRAAEVALPDAPLDAFTWSYARDVDANSVQIKGVPGAMTDSQAERFLFYRGLGDFALPVEVKAEPGGMISATNQAVKMAVGSVFVLNVGASLGSFAVHKEGLPWGAQIKEAAPSLNGKGALEIDAFVEALGSSVTEALDATGLYHDEAIAMVNTWKRQWFRTPGIRVLYLAPQAWTDASIPLTIEPAPSEVTRVMMIRVEVITPELEDGDAKAAADLGVPAAAEEAKEHFRALGRFAEPRLRRALSLLGDPAFGAELLAEVTSADTTTAAGE